MSIEGEVVRAGDREGFMALRQSVASGTIEGEEFDVTQNVASGEIIVEFEGEEGPTTVTYSVDDMVQNAYRLKEEAEQEDQ
mgnify:CR=1 FL=1